MEEIWKDIPGYEGIYQASTEGRIKSLKRKDELIMNPPMDKQGYRVVKLNNKTRSAHQLIAITFLNHIPDGHKLVIDHINGIKSDNRLENLRIVTQFQNMLYYRESLDIIGSSNYKGISFYKRDSKWRANINYNGTQKHIGYFDSELEAHGAYLDEFKRLNI